MFDFPFERLFLQMGTNWAGSLYLTSRRLRSGSCLVTSLAVFLGGWGGCIISAREMAEDIMMQIKFRAREYGAPQKSLGTDAPVLEVNNHDDSLRIYYSGCRTQALISFPLSVNIIRTFH